MTQSKQTFLAAIHHLLLGVFLFTAMLYGSSNKVDKFDLSAKSLFAKSLSVKLSRCNLSIFKMSVCKMSASKKNPWHHKTQKGAGDIKVRWQIGSMKIRDNFFTRVLIYLLPGVCIYSLEHLEDFCWIRFSSLKAKVSEI